MAGTTGAQAKRQGRAGQLSSYLIGFVVCVLLPAFITIIAPLSFVTLRYDGEVVSASATRFVYLVVPYHTERLGEVSLVEYSERAGGRERQRRVGEDSRYVHVEGEAALIISGGAGEIVVPVSPVNIDRVVAQAEAFVANPDRAGLSLFAVANWKVSIIAGGLFSLLTLLYVAGSAIAIGRWIWRRAAGPRRRASAA
jgi:hypothetical protein